MSIQYWCSALQNWVLRGKYSIFLVSSCPPASVPGFLLCLDGFSLRSLQHNIRRVFIFFSRSEVPIFSFSSPIAWQEYCNRKDYN